MKKSVLMILIAFSTTAWADDKQDQRNVYDVFRQWMKPSAGTTVEEKVTADIKRHMANLLYPVDMSSFAGPDKDVKFRDLIMALQRQMGAAPTGNLTSDQFGLLAEASRDVDDLPLPVMGVYKKNFFADGTAISASGTIDGYRHPINMARIFCRKPYNNCELTTAFFDPKANFLYLDETISYEIKTWTQDRVTAILESPCGAATMTVNVNAKTVNIVMTPGCFGPEPSVWTLVGDGFDVAWKLHQDRINKARALVYEPARKLVPLDIP